MGHCLIGNVTFESAAYVARYVMKKVSGDMAESHYRSIIPETGEIVDRLPEYTTMSLKPAIAAGWFKQFSSDVFPSDEVIMRGRVMKPPRYYSVVLARDSPDLLAEIKGRRVRMSKKHLSDATPSRLRVREYVKQAQINHLKRSL